MHTRQALITLCHDEIAPRFDMTAEILIVPLVPGQQADASLGRHMVLARVSGEELCDVATRAGVSLVVCGGIEEDYYHYLRWKRIDVVCDVMGPVGDVLGRLASGKLTSGDCLYAGARAVSR